MIVSDDAMDFASRQGLKEAAVLLMVSQSARLTSPKGNRRYHQYVFQVEGDMVLTMDFLQSVAELSSPNEFVVYEECEACSGEGCQICEFEGNVPVIRKMC